MLPVSEQERVPKVSSSERVVFLNDKFVAEHEAALSIFDRGVLYGDAVFETAFAWDGRIFKLDRHLERLRQSLQVVCIELPMTFTALREAIVETVRRNQLQNAYIKWLVTRGTGPMLSFDLRKCVPSVIVFARDYLYLMDPAKAAQGISVNIPKTRRIPQECLDPRVKSVNYLSFVVARIEATRAGYDETILLDMAGRLTEASGYNLFVVKNGGIATPSEGVLEGVTRETILDLCAELRIPATARSLTPYDAYTADEVFLTSTAGGLVPVRAIDGRQVGTGQPGPVFYRLKDAYEALIASGTHGTPIYS